MESILIALHVFVSIALILVVLLQSGKGADMGASFGGATQSAYGSGGGNVMTRLTAGAAIAWMSTSLVLALMSAQSGSIFDDAAEPAALTPTAPTGAPPAETGTLRVGQDSEGLVVNVEPAKSVEAVPAEVVEAVEAVEAEVAPVAEEVAPAAEEPAAEEAPAAE